MGEHKLSYLLTYLLLMTDKQEWRSWIAQCARHGID